MTENSPATPATLPEVSASPDNASPPVGQGEAPPPVQYSQSGGWVELLARHNIAVAFTSYQSGILYMLGRDAAGAHLHETAISKPMGLARDRSGGLLLSAGYQILRFTNPLAAEESVNDMFDACYVPRTIHVTGQLDAHDIGFAEDDSIVFVNTRFNCLATVDERNSFRKVWMPPFISDLIDEDRCHLNGLAMRNGRPGYVSAVSRSNTVDGWRDRRADGGVVIDVDSDQIVCSGLSMPHSPRIHKGELWILNSGTGDLGIVENAASGTGTFVPKTFCPGFLRGLSFHGDLAFVGLSKPRYQRFEGLALDQRLREADSEPWCGIQVIDIKSGTCVEWFRIDGNVSELYDVEVLPQVRCPMALGPESPEIVKFVTV